MNTLIHMAIGLSVIWAQHAAATEFDRCIPVDAVHAFLQGASGEEFALRSDIPEAFPEFHIAKGHTMLGSMVSDYSTLVALSSGLDRERAQNQVATSFTSTGWSPPMPLASRIAGIRRPTTIDLGLRLCHADGRTLHVRSFDRGSGSITNVQVWSDAGTDCASGQAQTEMATSVSSGEGTPERERPSSSATPLIPLFDPPEDARIGGQSSRLGPDSTDIATGITSQQTIADLMAHFADQLASDGWSSEAEWQSSRSLSSIWTKETGPRRALGALSITRLGGDRYLLRFAVDRVD